MNASEFMERLKGLAALNGTAEYNQVLQDFRQDLWNITAQEEHPYPPGDYPAWQTFSEKYAVALKGSHINAHYFEFSPSVLSNIGSMHDRLVDFVERNRPDTSMLEHFVRQQRGAGRLLGSQPVEMPAWRAAKCPGKDTFYIQTLVKLNSPSACRRVHANIEDVSLVKRHGGKQIQFAISPDKSYEPSHYSSVMLALWVYVSQTDSSEREVLFGTSYIGDNFPFQSGDIMGSLLNPRNKQKKLQEDIESFLLKHQDNTMYALLSPKVIVGYHSLK